MEQGPEKILTLLTLAGPINNQNFPTTVDLLDVYLERDFGAKTKNLGYFYR